MNETSSVVTPASMWWRRRARALLRAGASILRSPPPPPPPRPTRTLTRVPPPHPLSRFISSARDPIPDASATAAAAAAAADSFHEVASSPTEATPDDILASQGSGADAVADPEEVARVCAAVEASPEDKIDSTLADMGVDFNEPLLAAVILAAKQCSSKKLVSLGNYAAKNNRVAKSLSSLEILVRKVAASDEIDKTAAFMLWDWVKKFGSVPGSVSTPLLNKMISVFRKVREGKAALEVFGKFDEFGCTPDSFSYYVVIRAATVQGNVLAACEACEKMIASGCFPYHDQVGKILISLCNVRVKNTKARKLKLKVVHSLYLAAKEKEIQIPKPALDSLVCALARSSKTIGAAVELLEEYQGESLKNAGDTFAAVIHNLCRKNRLEDAKTLLMRMVNAGPAPGKAEFNSVITALSDKGEMEKMEDARGLMRVMESQGVSPDIYTYSVLMSAYAKGGMIAEAHALLREAQKLITPTTFKPTTDQ